MRVPYRRAGRCCRPSARSWSRLPARSSAGAALPVTGVSVPTGRAITPAVTGAATPSGPAFTPAVTGAADPIGRVMSPSNRFSLSLLPLLIAARVKLFNIFTRLCIQWTRDGDICRRLEVMGSV